MELQSWPVVVVRMDLANSFGVVGKRELLHIAAAVEDMQAVVRTAVGRLGRAVHMVLVGKIRMMRLEARHMVLVRQRMENCSELLMLGSGCSECLRQGYCRRCFHLEYSVQPIVLYVRQVVSSGRQATQILVFSTVLLPLRPVHGFRSRSVGPPQLDKIG